ncbi:hypothetical protein STAQ_49710 [Allostella sp. ATCC 35155]|nr:hypothetical protein STAQ_49710 [Stella sp. ATCC 35155]
MIDESAERPPSARRPILAPADAEMIRQVRVLIDEDRFDEALTAVERMSSRPQLRWVGRRLIAASRHAERLGFAPAEQTRRALGTLLADIHSQDRPVPHNEGGAMIVERAGAEQAVIVFSGNEHVPFAHVILQSYLRRRPCHSIYVTDRRQLFGVGGLPGLGADFPESVRSLRAVCDRLGAKRRFCFGFSGNGYAAMRHAVELDADGVLAFSPPTRLDLEPEKVAAVEMIRRLHDHVPHMAEDLKRIYLESRRLPATTIVYGAASNSDTRYALRMRSVPNVRLIPIPGFANHDSLSVSIVSGKLAGMLDLMLAGRAVDHAPVAGDGAAN